jgi:hypothetical protein
MQVPPLDTGQISALKRDGYLVLAGVLDTELCASLRDGMWAELTAAVPRLRRDDASTWYPFTADESPSTRRGPEYNNSHEGGDPRLECGPGHRYYLRNGTDELLLDLFPRALMGVAEQLLGTDEVVFPRGNVDGKIVGPCFMDANVESAQATHTGTHEPRYPPPLATEELEISPSGPGTFNGQGTRGLYCTLPNSKDPREERVSQARPGETKTATYPGMHSDGGIEGRTRLRATAFIGDCPPGSGGFTLWPGSHTAIWRQQWEATQRANTGRSPEDCLAEWARGVEEGLTYRQNFEHLRGFDGYTGEVMEALRQREPVELSGNAGTVVLWHGVLAHCVGQNKHTDVVRVASIYEFHKTVASLPDTELRRRLASVWGEEAPPQVR